MTPDFRRWLVFFSVVLFLLAGVAVFAPMGQKAWAQDKTPAAKTGEPAKTGDPAKAGEAKEDPQGDGRISIAALKEKGGDLGTTPLDRLRSLFGVCVLVMICMAMSNNPSKISWKLVAWGLGLQISLGLIVLSPIGNHLFGLANKAFTALMDCSTAGSKFVFGKLAEGNHIPVGKSFAPFGPPVVTEGLVADSGAFFAFNVLPTIIFFSSLMAVLYHLGCMQFIVSKVAWIMRRTMGTSGSETLSAAGNIFVGQTEAPLLVRPYVSGMTQSELMAVMTGGFATVAGGVMAAYVGFLQGAFSDIAGHLLSASVMSAPAALVCAKIMIPEPNPEKSETFGDLKVELEKVDANVVDAAARGAGDGLKLALNVGAMLLAFIALVFMVNQVVKGSAGLVADVAYGNDWEERVTDARDDLKSAQKLKDVADRAKAEAKVSERLGALALEALGNPEGLQVNVDLASEASPSQITTGTLILNPADLEKTRPEIKGVAAAVPSVSPYRYLATDVSLESLWRTLSIEKILGWLLAPLAFIMGVPMVDCVKVGQLIGIKTVVNEFFAYIQLGGMLDTGQFQHPRSVIIAVYSLCGFANFSSIAIQIGGIGGIAPERRSDLAKLGLRAMIAGTIACLMTATVAGMLI